MKADTTLGVIISHKAELLAQMERVYSEFLARIAAMDDRQFGTEREAGINDWTPKDVVAHVAFWDELLSKLLLASLVEATPFSGINSYDQINARSTVLRRSEQLSRILEKLGTAQRDVLTSVNDFTSDETLHCDVPVAYASRVDQRPLRECVHFSLPRAWILSSNAR
ncbi:MAG: ClbS/DfsB family four-helix bundle protein [Chloroflexi bacterium]|nr:ClbS/DfsB family four-helix bundle protein [Chloroflexota bacterium]